MDDLKWVLENLDSAINLAAFCSYVDEDTFDSLIEARDQIQATWESKARDFQYWKDVPPFIYRARELGDATDVGHG